MTSRPTLPPGAKGIDFGNAVVMFARDKIVLSEKGKARHLTVHFGPYTGVIDIHETSTTANGKSYRTIYSIPHAKLPLVFADLMPATLEALASVLCPLDLDDFIQKDIAIVVGLLTKPEEIDSITTVRRSKLVLDSGKIESRIRIPSLLDELHDLKDGEFFTLFSTRRRRPSRLLGHGFATTYPNGQRELVWLSTRRLTAAMTRLGPVLRAAAFRHGTLHEAPERMED